MKREIKFRGKKVDNGEWVYGYLVISETSFTKNQHCIIELKNHFQTSSTPSGNLCFSETDSRVHVVIPETVGQLWTPSEGLIVYTGDLLTAICSPSGSRIKKERICAVTFDGRGMYIAVWHEGEWWGYGSMNFETAKLVGNVFDNQYLLKQPK